MTTFDFAKKIQGLLAHAEDEANSPEVRAAFQLKAEELMRKYQIAEEELIAGDAFSVLPVEALFTILEFGGDTNPLAQKYLSLWRIIADHCGVESVARYSRFNDANDDNERKTAVDAIMIGYQIDIDFTQYLYTAARLVFLARIDARVNPALSDAENCYFMRNSGLKRSAIAKVLWGSAPTDGAAHGRVQKLYMAECARRGETARVSGRGLQVELYREAYATEFLMALYYRLMKARDAADSSGGGIVLHGRTERVKEAFWNRFPNLRPMSDADREAYQARLAEEAEEEANCPCCRVTKSVTGKCKRHRPLYMTEVDRRKQDRRYNSPEARAGARAGAAAANGVHLQRGTAGTAKLDASGVAIGG